MYGSSRFRAKCSFTTKALSMIFKRKSAILFLLGTEINKCGRFAFKRTRKFIFLLGAKGSENGKGLFSESAPCNPKTPHTPASNI